MNKISQVNECAKYKKNICKSDHKPDIEELMYGYPRCWDLPHPNHCSEKVSLVYGGSKLCHAWVYAYPHEMGYQDSLSYRQGDA
jgi:hypothetical protein